MYAALKIVHVYWFYPVAVDSHTDSEECDADSDDGNEGKRTAIKKRSELFWIKLIVWHGTGIVQLVYIYVRND